MNEVEITWELLVRLEPRLTDLLVGARFAGTGFPEYCKFDAWYGKGNTVGFKLLVTRLAGFEASLESHPLLRTTSAYDIAYKMILNAMPDCRGSCGHDEDFMAAEAIKTNPPNITGF